MERPSWLGPQGLLCLLVACAANTPLAKAPPAAETATVARELGPEAAAAAHQPCGLEPRSVGRIEAAELDEISGITESRLNLGVFFVHNDSGDSPRFFAIDRAGHLLAELELLGVPVFIDAEDIALGPAPGGKSYVYLGDTGNNFASLGLGLPRRKAVLYRVAEPRVTPSSRGQRIELDDVLPIVFTFPDGARDVEAFFVDPRGGDLYMIGKQRDGHSQILTASAAALAAGGGRLQLAGELVFGQGALPGSSMPTAASISRDGSAILIRTYSSVFLFRRRPGEPVMAALRRPPRRLEAPSEAQGEAIGFADSDRAFVTVSEGDHPLVHCGMLPQ